MKIWPEKRNAIQSRLVAIRSDVETLGDDIRGLVDDVASFAGARAGETIAPVAQSLNTVSLRLNGGPWGLKSPQMRHLAIVTLATVGGAALVAGVVSRR